MKNKIRNIIFDYGGTLDTDGVHWSENFWDVYRNYKIPVGKRDFRDAFIYSERKIIKIIKPGFSLKKTCETQLYYQFKYLEKIRLITGSSYLIINDMSSYCVNKVLEGINTTRKTLDLLKGYNLGLVSNYYGNIETILEETGLKKYFKTVIDSSAVGFRKPDKKIFKIALKKLNARPDKTAVIGDSYENDIIPAKELGCTTIWLDVRSWSKPDNTGHADFIIKSLDELTDYVQAL